MVEVLGFDSNPLAGDDFIVIDNESKAKEIANHRLRSVKIKETVQISKYV